jgi:hypothetical protein
MSQCRPCHRSRALNPLRKKTVQKKNPEKEILPLPIIDAFSDDSDDKQAYSSSDEEGEVYIRGKMGKKRKVAAREELPRGREPVSNPLTLEERIRRKETRVAEYRHSPRAQSARARARRRIAALRCLCSGSLTWRPAPLTTYD